MIVVTFDSSVNLVNVLFVFCFNQFYLCCHLTNKVVYIITASMSHCHPQVIIIIIYDWPISRLPLKTDTRSLSCLYAPHNTQRLA